ncbi:MAG: OmpA family protein [Prevotellaceae bacterium]|nr:OmpA family protein [Prevotellaceae bacterium]MDO4932020.1 OmpA family protein [Prevotellaceae bacterium]
MRKILILSIGFALSSGVQAKDCHHTADTTTIVRRLAADEMLRPLKPTYMKGALVASPWTDKWFVQAAGGTTVFLGTPLGCNDLFGRMKPAFSVSLGKWFTPSVGGRLNYGGMQINDCNNQSQDYQYLRADFMWNVLGNIYKNDVHSFARWSVIPYVGAGMLHNKGNGHKPFAVSYGIQGQYHLSRRIAVTAEIGNMTTMQDFDGYGKAHRFGDHLLSASLGLSVHIGKSGWRRAIDACPYIAQNEWLSAYAASLSDENYLCHAQHERDRQTLEQLRKILAIEGLLDRYNHLFPDDAASTVTNGYPRNDYSGLNSLRARMRDRNGNGQNPKVMESVSYTEEYGSGTEGPDGNYLSHIQSGKTCIGAPVYFFFELGSDRLLNKSQLVNLDEVARIAKKYGLMVKVVGAADSATGNEAINDNLSRSRADYIASELLKRGMENGTVTKGYDGGIDDYSPNEANRHTRIMLYFKQN